MARRDALLRLHKSLVARGSALRKALAGELADLRFKTTDTGDSADAAFDAGSEEVSSQLAELEARELSQIERALARIKQGSYGSCELCQAKIPVARLNILPYSTTCVNCQREMEIGIVEHPASTAHREPAVAAARPPCQLGSVDDVPRAWIAERQRDWRLAHEAEDGP